MPKEKYLDDVKRALQKQIFQSEGSNFDILFRG